MDISNIFINSSSVVKNNSNLLVNTTNITDIYSEQFRIAQSKVVYKKYLIYDNVDYTDNLYIEFSYLEQVNITDKYLSYYKLNIYWFTNNTFDNYTKGLFFGIANTKKFINNSQQSDLIICKFANDVHSRCDDYFMYHSGYYIENDFLNEFNPLLDYRHNGNDNILNYCMNFEISSNVNPFKSLITFSVILASYSQEIYDLDLDFKNNLTVFYGQINKNNLSSNDLFEVSPSMTINKVTSANYSEIILYSAFLKINYFFIILYFCYF